MRRNRSGKNLNVFVFSRLAYHMSPRLRLSETIRLSELDAETQE